MPWFNIDNIYAIIGNWLYFAVGIPITHTKEKTEI